jgi:alpha-L-fucosidase
MGPSGWFSRWFAIMYEYIPDIGVFGQAEFSIRGKFSSRTDAVARAADQG